MYFNILDLNLTRVAECLHMCHWQLGVEIERDGSLASCISLTSLPISSTALCIRSRRRSLLCANLCSLSCSLRRWSLASLSDMVSVEATGGVCLYWLHGHVPGRRTCAYTGPVPRAWIVWERHVEITFQSIRIVHTHREKSPICYTIVRGSLTLAPIIWKLFLWRTFLSE